MEAGCEHAAARRRRHVDREARRVRGGRGPHVPGRGGRGGRGRRVGQGVVSFDTIASRLPRIEVYGSSASLDVPDPNQFANPVGISRARTEPFSYVSDLAGYADAGRGYGLSDLARAIGEGAPHRQSAELGFHVHEVMERIAEASLAGATVGVVSRCERPAAVPQGAKPDIS